MVASTSGQLLGCISLMCGMTALYALLFTDATTAFGSNELSRVYKVTDDMRSFGSHDPLLGSTSSVVTVQKEGSGSTLVSKGNSAGAAGTVTMEHGVSGVSVSIEEAAKEEGFGEAPALKQVSEDPLVLQRKDKAMRLDTSPVVVTELKLIFFSLPKNGGTQFKKLFRRVAGRSDWNSSVTVTGNESKREQTRVHDPRKNGLYYLSGYSTNASTKLVNDKDWTIAIFFRDPFSRFLSVYLDHFARKKSTVTMVSQDSQPIHAQNGTDTTTDSTGKSKSTSNSQSKPSVTFEQFISLVETGLGTSTTSKMVGSREELDKITQELTPQCSLMDCDKWYPYMTYIGSFENIYEDTRTLLERLQAWEKYGGNGWGGATGELFKETLDTELVTNATQRMHEYYTPSLFKRVSAFVKKDVDFLRKVQLERATATAATTVTDKHNGHNGYSGKVNGGDSKVAVLDPARLVGIQQIVLKKGDIELKRHSWEGSPIVVEKFKLIFFSVPKNSCTIFKKLFRRIEGKTNWNAFTRSVPHDPRRNGLRYLYKYSVEEANRIVNDPAWTVAIFVRDPYTRFLSAYLDKGRKRVSTFSGFVKRVERGLKNVHWNPQCHLVDCPKWLSRLDFIGSVERIYDDTKELLQRLGAWEEYGANGWGGTGEIFKGSVHKGHVTNADDKLNQYYTPQLKTRVKALLHKDFEFLHTIQQLKSGNTSFNNHNKNVTTANN